MAFVDIFMKTFVFQKKYFVDFWVSMDLELGTIVIKVKIGQTCSVIAQKYLFCRSTAIRNKFLVYRYFDMITYRSSL